MKESDKRCREPLTEAPAKKEYWAIYVRIDWQVHRALAIEAAQAGVTLNALVTYKTPASALLLTTDGY